MLAGSTFYWWAAKRVKGVNWSIENLGATESHQAVLMIATMFVHSIPEGIAIGVGHAILSSIPQPLAAIPAFVLVGLFQPLLPAGLGFAGGAMIFLVAAELIPDSLERCSRDDAAWGVVLGLVLMLFITAVLGLLTPGSGEVH